MHWMGREIRIATDASMGVAGRPWQAQEVAARLAVALPREEPVLELGSGCGGLAAFLALEGYQVVATDFAECSPLVTQTAQLNGVHVAFHTLPWGDLDAMEGALRLLSASRLNLVACEVAYWGGWSILEEDPLEALVETLSFFLRKLKGSCLLVYESRERPREHRLFELLALHHLEWSCLKEPLQEGDVGAWLLRSEGSEERNEESALRKKALMLQGFSSFGVGRPQCFSVLTHRCNGQAHSTWHIFACRAENLGFAYLAVKVHSTLQELADGRTTGTTTYMPQKSYTPSKDAFR